jgi:hypothetical protein
MIGHHTVTEEGQLVELDVAPQQFKIDAPLVIRREKELPGAPLFSEAGRR